MLKCNDSVVTKFVIWHSRALQLATSAAVGAKRLGEEGGHVEKFLRRRRAVRPAAEKGAFRRRGATRVRR
jgi:hypothetical protein